MTDLPEIGTPMDEQNENVEQMNEEPQETTNDAKVKRDQERITRWQEAAQHAPSADEVRGLREHAESIAEQLRQATEQYQATAAHRATVFGFNTVSKEEGTPTKRIHFWKSKYHADMEDLSSVPDVEMVREERRIAEQERVLKTQEAMRAMLARRQQRLDAAREAMNR